MSKEMNFLNTTSVDNSSSETKSSSQNSKQEAKTAPSLFDSLLSGSSKNEQKPQNLTVTNTKTQETSQQQNSASSTTTQTTNSVDALTQKNAQTATNSNENLTQASKNSDKSSENSSAKNSKTPSLLDKLLAQANESIEQAKTQKSTPNNADVKNSMAQKNSASSVETSNTKDTSNAKANLQSNAQQSELKKNNTIEEAKVNTTTSNNDKQASGKPDVVEQKSTQAQNDTQKPSSLFDNLTQVNNKQQQAPNATQDEVLQNKQVKHSSHKESANEAVEIKNQNKTQTLFEQLTQENQDDAIKVQENKEQSVDKKVDKLATNANTAQETLLSTMQTKAQGITQTATNTQTSIETQGITQTVTEAQTKQNMSQKASLMPTQTLSNEEAVDVKQNSSEDKNKPTSLLDKLLEQTKTEIQKQTAQGNTVTQQSTIESEIKNRQDPILTNIYLSSLNKSLKDSMLENSFHAKTVLGQASSVADVQKGANLLDLNLQDSEVITKQEEFKTLVKSEFLHKIAASKENIQFNMMQKNDEFIQTAQQIKSALTTAQASSSQANNSVNIAQEVELNIPGTLAFNIENRIIGARQQMNNMMSDVARSMYLNYKPPVTAFRMNLNPANLGNIAVLIKSDKQNGLSISLNMSNVATLDSFVENQTALRAALAKNFETTTNINLEFNMQGEQKDSNAQQQNQQSQQQAQKHSTSDLMHSLSQKNDQEINAINYM
jgi:hypothetical protein